MTLFNLLIFLLLTVQMSKGQESHYPFLLDTTTSSVQSGYFDWNDNTVIVTKNIPSTRILHYQSILDHSNTDFGEHPESVILIELIPGVTHQHSEYIIRITQDSIHVQALTVNSVEKGLKLLRQLKNEAEADSPDYGLLYLRCGLYRSKNF